jgi:hypothetical protein
MDDVIEYIIKTFPKSNLNITFEEIRSDVNIRFELNDIEMFQLFRNDKKVSDKEWAEIKLTKKERKLFQEHHNQCAIQSTKRAIEIFENIFFPNDEIWLVINDFPNEFFDQEKTFKNYLYEQLENREKIQERTIISLDDEDKIEYQQKFYKGKLEEINYKNILGGIANLEMGRSPKVTQVVFYMYDDRGCLVYSNNSEKIRFLYTKYNDCIVDYHRNEIDKIFNKNSNTL